MSIKENVRVVLDLLPEDCNLDDVHLLLDIAQNVTIDTGRTPTHEELVEALRRFNEEPTEESGPEHMMFRLPIGYQFARRVPLFASSPLRIKGVVFPIFALSITSFLLGLMQFSVSHLGAGLTFGGALLAYESIYVLFREP